jgi:hypothetical protein
MYGVFRADEDVVCSPLQTPPPTYTQVLALVGTPGQQLTRLSFEQGCPESSWRVAGGECLCVAVAVVVVVVVVDTVCMRGRVMKRGPSLCVMNSLVPTILRPCPFSVGVIGQEQGCAHQGGVNILTCVGAGEAAEGSR